MQPYRRAREINWEIRVELSNCFTQRWPKSIRTLACTRTNDDRAELRGWVSSKQRKIKARSVSLLIERALHQGVRNNADDCSPRLGLPGIENANPATDWTFVTKIFLSKARVDDGHRLLRVRIVDAEIAAFQDLQTERRKIVIRDRFKVSLWAIAIRDVILSVHFILPEAVEGHAKTTGQRGRIELRIGPQRPNRAEEEFTPGLLGRIRAFH